MAKQAASGHALTRRAALGLGAAAVLGACGQREPGEERRGLFGFGRDDEPETLEPEGGFLAARPDPRPLAPRADSVTVEPTNGGVIVRASAVMPRQGYWDADLVPALGDNPQNGVYLLDFRAFPPTDGAAAAVGPARARELGVAFFLSNGALEGVRSVSVRTEAGTLSRRL